MAKLNSSLIPVFTNAGIRGYIKSQTEEYQDKVLRTLQYFGDEFVNRARSIRTYEDQTGNLRSSIGYIILKDGRMLDANFEQSGSGTDGSEGVKQGQAYANEIALEYPQGYVLIGVAGMSYAAAVEARKYDVITGSAPVREEIIEFLSGINL